MRLIDLQEERSAVLGRMRAADQAQDQAAFDAANSELQAIDTRIARTRALEAAERAQAGEPISGDAQLASEVRNRYSLTRALANAAGLPVDAGFEREVQGEIARRTGRSPQGFFVPAEALEQRVLTSTAGAELIPTDHRPELYIPALTAASVVRMMGATVLSGLTGNVSIPRETASPTAGFVADNAALSSTDADFDAVTLSPKHVGALSEWSRNMLLQSSPDVEALLRQMLARNLALAIDRAAIKGGGTNEPKGVLTTVGIQTQAYATSLFNTNAEMIAKADIANVGAARRGFLSSNTVKKIAMKAQDAQKLPVGVATIFHGEPVTFSNQVPENLGGTTDEFGLIYGDWSELTIGVWSEIDVLVNPYEATAYSKGNVSIRAMATVDFAVRHPASFVSATGVKAAAVGIA